MPLNVLCVHAILLITENDALVGYYDYLLSLVAPLNAPGSTPGGEFERWRFQFFGRGFLCSTLLLLFSGCGPRALGCLLRTLQKRTFCPPHSLMRQESVHTFDSCGGLPLIPEFKFFYAAPTLHHFLCMSILWSFIFLRSAPCHLWDENTRSPWLCFESNVIITPSGTHYWQPTVITMHRDLFRLVCHGIC